MCGEHDYPAITYHGDQGSSPHVRGAPRLAYTCNCRMGIIPACAGSTSDSQHWLADDGDHPRMCGEHMSAKTSQWFVLGSSPHVRGAQRYGSTYEQAAGIIPACAGSTDVEAIKQLIAGDHPRMCGEHAVRVRRAVMVSGSSPHVRGARMGRSRNMRRHGIIPACAGSTLRK